MFTETMHLSFKNNKNCPNLQTQSLKIMPILSILSDQLTFKTILRGRLLNTSRLRQDGHHFADIFKFIFSNESV